MSPTSPLIREMIVPVRGDIECIGFRKDQILEYESAARNSLAGLGIRQTRKQINKYVDRITKPELINISDVEQDRKWTLYRLGDLRFAPYRTTRHYRGQLTHYRVNDRWFLAKDQYGTPYGPKSKGSDPKNWKPLYPRTGNVADGLSYTIESADELQFGYAFGKTYSHGNDDEPLDEVVERGQTLATINARLSSQAHQVAGMLVNTEDTDTLAQNYADIGRALAARKSVSERTLIRQGKVAVEETAKEIDAAYQTLAA
jgi:hypothetical protein